VRAGGSQGWAGVEFLGRLEGASRRFGSCFRRWGAEKGRQVGRGRHLACGKVCRTFARLRADHHVEELGVLTV
jgi:hypothetical protein